MKKDTKYTIALFIGLVLIVTGMYREITNETPIEKYERLNRMADYECLSKSSDKESRDCYEWWYSQIEDRD